MVRHYQWTPSLTDNLLEAGCTNKLCPIPVKRRLSEHCLRNCCSAVMAAALAIAASNAPCIRNQCKPQSHQACDQVTTYLRPKNGPIVERTYDWWQSSYDWGQRWWVIARGKSVATRSYSCSKPGHTGLTTRLRPTCDRKKLE